MARLIDADALKKENERLLHCDFPYLSEITLEELIDEAPTIDAVPKEKILLFLNIANEELSKAHANKSGNGIVTWSASVTTLEGLLKKYDTADTDVVPVIRCKDCKYSIDEYHDGECYCDYTKCLQYIKDWNHYCSWAKRREE